MKIKFHFLPLVVALFAVFFSSCENNSEEIPVFPKNFKNGVFITNEGPMNSNTGSISFFSKEYNTLYNDIYTTVNTEPLGDVVQSFTKIDSLGFIAVNNSAKVTVVSLKNFKKKTSIKISQPRYMLPVNQSVYVTSQGSFPGKVYIIDESTLKITDSITVGLVPENLLKQGNYVYVSNGKWGYDSTISKINISTKQVENTITVGDGPTDMVADANGKIWTICQGSVTYNNNTVVKETDSKLVQFDPSGNILKSMVIGTKGDFTNPSQLSISADGKTVYFAEQAGVFAVQIDANTIPSTPLISLVSIYGLEVDPNTGNIFVMETPNYTTAGNVKIYKANGTLINSFMAGIIPNGAYFVNE